MSNKNDDSKYQLASTDEYGIKTTKGGQKYLICHFMPVQEDNWDKKLRRKNNGNKLGKYVLKDNFEYTKKQLSEYKREKAKQSAQGRPEEVGTCATLFIQNEQGKVYPEPFSNGAIGYVLGDYEFLHGYVKNMNTIGRGADEAKQISNIDEYLHKYNEYLQSKLKETEEDKDRKEEFEINYLKETNTDEKEKRNRKIQLHNQILANNTLNEEEKLKISNLLFDEVENNQCQIGNAKIKSLIINIALQLPTIQTLSNRSCQKVKPNEDNLIQVVSEINNIIDIQYNKLGHKSILVRDAGSKKITKMELDKFVDCIKEECEKIGIDIKTINKNFPTKEDVNKMINSIPLQTKEQKPTPPKKHGRWCRFKKWFKNLFSFNYHDKNNAHASYDTNVIKNDINTMIYSNM